MNRLPPDSALLPGPEDPRGVGALLEAAARARGERTAIVCVEDRRRTATYADLDRAARRAAARLREVGVRPGDRVALVAANRSSFVHGWFGIAYAGATVVPIPILSAPAEVSFRVDHSRCATVVFDAERRPLVEAGAPDRTRLEIETLADASSEISIDPIDPGAAAMVLYTSGTTGKPRGAAISHRTLLSHAAAIGEKALRLDEDDTILGVLPLTHSYGLRMILLASFWARCRAVLVPRFDAAATLDLARNEGVNWLPAVPTMFSAWGALPPGPTVPTLRWCLSAGSPLADEILVRAEARIGAEIRQGYGMTEATFSTINAPPDRRVIGSVGRPARGVEVRITDQSGRDVGPGETGEVRVRGQNLMSHYLDDPDATRDALADGWLRTGDVGYLDEDGRLQVVDRLKDLILRGGNNVYPSEIEAVLAEHPDVREAAVIGCPDPHYGEEIVALIIANPGRTPVLEDIGAFVRERVARNKVPRLWGTMEEFPLGPSRKVLKRELRDRLAAGDLAVRRL